MVHSIPQTARCVVLRKSATIGIGLVFIIVLLLMQKSSEDIAPQNMQPLNTEVRSFDGKTWKLSALGKKPMLVNFWASFCPPCLKELPILNKLAHKYQDSVIFVGLAVGSPATEVAEIVQSLGITYPIAQVDYSVLEAWGHSFLPSTFIINEKGSVVWSHQGPASESELEKQLQKLYHCHSFSSQ